MTSNAVPQIKLDMSGSGRVLGTNERKTFGRVTNARKKKARKERKKCSMLYHILIFQEFDIVL